MSKCELTYNNYFEYQYYEQKERFVQDYKYKSYHPFRRKQIEAKSASLPAPGQQTTLRPFS